MNRDVPPMARHEGKGGRKMNAFMDTQLEDATQDLRRDAVDERVIGQYPQSLQPELGELIFQSGNLLVYLDNVRKRRTWITAQWRVNTMETTRRTEARTYC